MDHIPIFVYGELKRRGVPDRVRARGELRMRGTDAAARFGGQYQGWVYGQIRMWPRSHYAHLVRFEAPQYRPKWVRTSAGLAIAFEDVQREFEKETVVESGRYRLPRQ